MADDTTCKGQKQQVRQVVKDFVRNMVKGQKINVMMQNGQLKLCTVQLTRELTHMKVKVGGQSRTIDLKEIEDIAPGDEVGGAVDTPVDELCATLMLVQGDCITFRMRDIKDRDAF